mmetsp:Transcript_11351/g.14158  ORF Transcript_11351/g.14158 Transcript_11351/m.14158 type:complete len:164 (+) Transcript_11351:250-741(+)
MTRSLGDFQFKQAKGIPKHAQAITAEPEVTIREYSKDDNYIFLACDGIWDVMNNSQVVDFINKNINQNLSEENLDKLCHSLLLECLRLNSEDNMTAIIVCLDESDSSSGIKFTSGQNSSPGSVETPIRATNPRALTHRELFKESEKLKDDIDLLTKEEIHDLI